MKKLLLFSLLSTISLFAGFKMGDALSAITLPDQFDHATTIVQEDTTVIMAFEKEIAVAIADYLKGKSSDFLQTHHARYISDISAMPSFVTTMFALPKMKKYPFSVMLIRDDFGTQFDKQEGKITVYDLKGGKIVSIRFVSPDAIAAIFEKK